MDVKSRFLRYVTIPTASDENSPSVPSTEKQKNLGRLLADELLALGLTDAHMADNGYVYATLPANAKSKASIGLIAHMDTSPDAPDAPIVPRAIRYEGGDIRLSDSTVMKVSDFPDLSGCIGQELIVTDGNTLLGADDKAGVAIIMSALAKIIEEDLPHGKICIGFTPDEEIGRGADEFDVSSFGADYAYTVDGGDKCAIECENFNAASATVKVKGRGIHPGHAKDKMKNASLIGAHFISLLPEKETPAHTEDREGFYHLTDMKGDVEEAVLYYIIRDHDANCFDQRIRTMLDTAEKINRIYGKDCCTIEISESYRNMKQVIDTVPEVIERAASAMKSLGMTPTFPAIRGGTDGARLSFMGLPCPNLGTGGYNAHSRFEFVSVDDMLLLRDLVTRICTDLVIEE